MKFHKQITLGLNIHKNGKKIGSCITWLGCLGFLTAWKIDGNGEIDYTIAINYRRIQGINIQILI